MNTMTRRTALAGIATLPAAAVPGAALADPDQQSVILTLFREWDAIYQAGFIYWGRTDEECEKQADRMCRLADRMLEVPITGAADFAALLLAVTGYGDFDPGDILIAKAVDIIGGAPS